MTDETIALLLSLLDQVQLPGSAPDLEEQARRVVKARTELLAEREKGEPS